MTKQNTKFSKKWQLSKHDLRSILVTTWLLLIPVLFTIQNAIATGTDINWNVVVGAVIAVLIKVLQKVLTDYSELA